MEPIELDESAVIQRYGRKPAADQAMRYAKSLKLILAADGEIAAAELNALRRGMIRLGASDRFVKMVEDFDIHQHRLEEVLPDMKPGGLRARMLLRDAIEIASADGTYAAEERAAVAKAAQLLGVDPIVTQSIEAYVQLEHTLAHLRSALF